MDHAQGREWVREAACLRRHPEALFVKGAAQHRAKAICQPCPVRTECLSEALDERIEFGVWGGMTERERRRLLREHPEITSWREFFAQARAQEAGAE